MGARKFNAKLFNDEAFGKYEGTIPKPVINALISSGALGADSAIDEAFNGNVGLDTATVMMFGRTTGFNQPYNGTANIVASGMGSYKRSVQVFRKAGAWTEYDFTYDVTNGVSFIDQMAQQIAGHKDAFVQEAMLSTLEGIFNMTGSAGTEKGDFAGKHTFDITEETTTSVGATTLNSALQKACGDQRNKFGLGCFHSKIVADLENLNALDYLKYTDPQGVTRNLSMGTWNGKTILEDDGMPVYGAGKYRKVTSTTTGAKTIVANSATPGADEVKLSVVQGAGTMFGYTPSTGDYVKTYDKDLYVSYVLGQGSFGFKDVGAKVPYEAERDALVNGGQDTIISRVGYIVTPHGFSWEPASHITDPGFSDFKNGANWTLATDGEATPSYYPGKAIPIARILSLA